MRDTRSSTFLGGPSGEGTASDTGTASGKEEGKVYTPDGGERLGPLASSLARFDARWAATAAIRPLLPSHLGQPLSRTILASTATAFFSLTIIGFMSSSPISGR